MRRGMLFGSHFGERGGWDRERWVGGGSWEAELSFPELGEEKEDK